MAGLSIGNGLSTGNGLSAGSGFSRGGGLYFSGFSVAPTLNLNFTTMTALPSTITFSRNSNATYYDSTGKLTYAPNNQLTYSNDFSNAVWTKSGLTQSAGLVTVSAGTAWHRLSASGVATSAVTTTSVKLKAGTHRYVQILDDHAAPSNDYENFDLVAGTKSSSGVTSSISDAGDGYWLCSITGNGDLGNNGIYISPVTGLNAARAESWTATGTETFYVKEAQLELVTYQTTPGTYNATTSAAYYGARLDYNPATLAARGLLIEEARTNSALYSQDFSNGTWVAFSGAAKVGAATGIVDPAGTQNAYELSFGATGGTIGAASAVYQACTFTASSFYSFSVYLRAKTGTTTIRLSAFASTNTGTADITLTTAWTRVLLENFSSGAATSGNIAIRNNVAGNSANVYAWGAQVELGSFATSYIPTAGGTVSRSADTASMTGTNFSSWYNQSEGSFVVNTTPLVATGSLYSNGVFGLLPTTGTGGGSFFLGQSATQNWLWWRANGSMAVTFGTVVANTPAKLAIAYKLADYAAVANNGTVGTSSDATALVNATSLSLGGQYAIQPYGGYIASFVYYPQRLPNATLQSLTS